jgi:hypothetical protein
VTEIVVRPDAEDTPGTHALVIGVGHYRYLKNGEKEKRGLWISGDQLTSPPVSAFAFADWLLTRDGEGFRHPDAPLATVELLVSTQPQLTSYRRPDLREDVALDRATFENLEEAFKRWRQRLDRTAENVGLFFFSGHGFARVNLGLLLEDLGEDSDEPFVQSFDFDKTWQAMNRCAARRQYYFVDACQTTLSHRDLLEDPWKPLWGLQRSKHAAPRTGGIFYASAPSSSAYGRKKSVSFFTKALLDGLKGQGSQEDADGVWVVRSDMLSAAINATFDDLRESGREAPVQSPRGSMTDAEPFHIVGDAPRVPVAVRCKPDKAHPHARLSIHEGGVEIKVRQPAAKRWDLELPPRTYKLGAAFPSGRYEPSELDITVVTPRYRRNITVVERVR